MGCSHVRTCGFDAGFKLTFVLLAANDTSAITDRMNINEVHDDVCNITGSEHNSEELSEAIFLVVSP
jgi:hypothetical protein